MTPPTANLSPVIDGQNRLRQDFKQFAQHWAATKEEWRDGRREQFEREHLQGLGPSLARLSAALDEWRDFVVKSDRELADTIAD
jgi:hypothetical protein